MAVFLTQDRLDDEGKADIGQRLKHPGMHWTVNGADSIITLRCAQASSQQEPIYSHRHNQTGAA
jgi:hypothetical protein